MPSASSITKNCIDCRTSQQVLSCIKATNLLSNHATESPGVGPVKEWFVGGANSSLESMEQVSWIVTLMIGLQHF